MRKLLLTTAFILPLGAMPVLAQDAATTEAPAGDATTAPAGDAAAPMGTEAPADAAADPAAADAEAADAEAAAQEAEVAASGKVAQDQAPNELRVDWISDASVTAPDGTAIGDINDLIVDGETGQMIAAVIGVGGFLGIGEKQIAVPWDQLTVNYDAQEVTSELTKEEADAAPEYVFREREAAPGAEAPAGGDTMATDPAAAPADPAAAPADPAAAPADPAADPAAAPADASGGMDAMAPTEGADSDMAAEPAEGGDDMAAEPAEGGDDMAAEPAEGGDDMAAEPAEGSDDMTAEPAEGGDAESTEEMPASN